MKRLAILGSTGSIGRNALAVVDAHPDRLAVTALVAGGNAALLAEQVARHRPSFVGVGTPQALSELTSLLPPGAGPTTGVGPEALVTASTLADVDVVLCASSGTAGLEAALAAIEAGKTLALANKEVLVMAGALMMEAACRRGVPILPVDSEHNAIHQCLHGRSIGEVRRLVLTASGGPFRLLNRTALAKVTPDDALRHPTWRMGRKITVDSATLMNKGLEVIEAHWLFGVPADAIDVVVHPQSIVHSMVELCDGSVIAQLGFPDMRLPIQYAFSYPERWAAPTTPLDLTRVGTIEFEPPDHDRFPCLGLAYGALRHGGAWPVVLNAANEVAVEGFLSGHLPFDAIATVIERALDASDSCVMVPRTIAAIRAADSWARVYASETLRTLRSS